ncbi:formyltransferase family protein [Burkholderia sp. TSV86]|uniref:formyltransferase family protein n=1 Tax=Burkholderia sp. TSV86 TaxID=1385594 RepID=UPI0009EBC2EE|nr:formyltransferase family protein [Burkholderia sp. TSV86]
MAKVVALIDCRLGLEVARYLERRGELLGLILHPSSQRNYIDEQHIHGFKCWTTTWPHGLKETLQSHPDYLLSVQFGFRITKEWLEIPNCVPLNVHPGYLPDNRGRAPTAWPIMDGSRAGVTLHIMTEEFDAGPYLAREEVPVYPEDTGDTLWERVEAAAFCMFKYNWPKVDKIEPTPQERGGAYHSLSDIVNVSLTEAELGTIDKLRARVYHGRGLRIIRDGHAYEVTVNISKSD